MPEITLDETTRKTLDRLPMDDALMGIPCDRKWLEYSVIAVAHIHLMSRAKQIAHGEISQKDFLKKYDLDFISQYHGFVASLKKIEADDIFIPKHMYLYFDGKKQGRKVHLFNHDYADYIMQEYAHKLTERKWVLSDLGNEELIEQGIRLGKDIFKECIYIHEFNDKLTEHQPKRITALGYELIEYYSSIISKSTTPK